MSSSKLRRQIAWEAARLMHSREVQEYFHAKQRAARKLGLRRTKPADLPSNEEVRHEIQTLTRLHDRGRDDASLRQMRIRALWWLRKLERFHPKLIGSVLTGHVREGSDIDVHLFSNHASAIVDCVEQLGFVARLERKRIEKEGELRVFTHIHVADKYPVELTVYGLIDLGRKFRSSITGKAIESARPDEFERFVSLEYDFDAVAMNEQMASMDAMPDRWAVYLALLVPLENAIGDPRHHPEGDALYHSLQVYDLALDEHGYDEDFLLAALLHDVGKAIDPADHVAAGLEALEGFISERTAWLIEHHMIAHSVHDRSIGARARRRLAAHPWFDDLMRLEACDREGRCSGVAVPEVEEALDYIESLVDRFGTP